ncbi:MAG: YfiR family protein [Methylococcales bacterium]|nr:YfiR family protein [Methylococcales bacterium]
MKYISVLWTIGWLLFSSVLSADEAASVEYKIKAGYLYNFTKFVTWSADNAAAFNICIVGNDPFGELIDPIEQRTVLTRPIKLLRYENLKAIDKGPHCHILFLTSAIGDKLLGRDFNNTLVVGESSGFIEQGGMIGFVKNQDEKIKLQVNLRPIKQGGLKISAKLLEVAEVVEGGE